MRTSTVSSLLITLLGLSFAPQAAAQYYGDDHEHTAALRCESYDGRTRHCPADTCGGVRLIRQLSRSACLEGRTWGADHHGVWVTQGCRAEFAIGYGGGRYDDGRYGDGRYDDYRRYPGDDRYDDRYRNRYGDRYGDQIIRCESHDGRQRYCPADTRGGVRLVRQLSRTPCVEGRNWGRDRGGIWVAGGCRADFEVGYRRDEGWSWGRD